MCSNSGPAVCSTTADLEAMTEVVIRHWHEVDLRAESRRVRDRGSGVLGRGALARFSPRRGCRRRGAVALGRSVLRVDSGLILRSARMDPGQKRDVPQ